MARSSLSSVTVLVAVLLVGSAYAQTTKSGVHDQCMSYFGGLGGKEGITQLVPTCKQGMRGFRGCCAEVKELVNKAPQGCLCDDDVWEELVQKVEEANIDGLTRERLDLFANVCGIAHSGNAGCRRLQRTQARSTRGSRARATRGTRGN